MSFCVRGCTHPSLHLSRCGCQPACHDHEGHCAGCLPVDAQVGVLCPRCAGQARSALWAMPGHLARIARLPEGKLNVAPGPVSDAPRAPSPEPKSVSPAADLVDEVTRWLVSWVDVACDETGLAGPDRYSRITGLPAYANPEDCVGFLVAQLRVLLAVDGKAFHGEAIAHRATLERALGWDEPSDRINEPCRRCELRLLTRENGGDNVVCGNPDCLAVWRWSEWLELQGAA